MDAQVANLLLVGNHDDLGSSRKESKDLYEKDRQVANRSLQQIAATVGLLNRPAQKEINSLLNNFGEYQASADRAILLEEQATNPVPGRPPTEALAAYRLATDEMHAKLLPTAVKLTSVNVATLNRTYDSRESSSNIYLWLVVLLGSGSVVSLLIYQFKLLRRFRRLFNYPLVLATLIAVVLCIAATTTLISERHELKVAKKDAADSLVVLSQDKAISGDANADESRYLVDPERATQYQQAFLEKSEQIVNLPGAEISTYDAAMRSAIAAYNGNHSRLEFTGFLGSEFRNITFTGERAAAEATLSSWRVYQQDDRRIRSLNNSGQLEKSIVFDTSHAQGDSNWAFDQYSAALDRLIAINQRAFDQAISSGDLNTFDWNIGLGVACLLVLGLIVIGTRPRLKEYT